MKYPSTQTLLSSDSFRTSSPDLQDFEQIPKKSKEASKKSPGRVKKVDHTFRDCDISSVGYQKSDQGSEFSKNYNAFSEKRNSNPDKNPFIWKSSSESLSYKNRSSSDLNPNSKYSDDQYINSGFDPDIEEDCLNKTSPESSTSKSSIFSIIYDPIFILITITNALYNFSFVCMMAVIVDFARDVGVGETNEKYVLMSLSAGDMVGRIGLGWLTDGG